MAGLFLLGYPQNLFIPADRNFAWTPGMTSQGGIPTRSTIYTTLSPSGGNDTSLIQAALDACPAGQVVKLNSGTFLINDSQTPLIITTGITLRGNGAGNTIIKKNTGAAALRTGSNVTGTTLKIPATQSGLDNCPLIIVGPGRFSGVDNHDVNSAASGSTSNLTSDGVAGTSSITVADGSIFTVGRFVLLDELTVASYVDTPRGFLNNNTNGTEGTVDVLAGDRVVWNIHNPTQTFQDDPPDAAGWFSRPTPVTAADPGTYTDGRLNCEIKEIASKAGNVIAFTSPLTMTYRASHTAQLTRYTSTPATGNSIHVTGAGVENLTLYRSGGGALFFNCAAYSWAKNIEVDNCFGLGIAIDSCFRCEVRDSYIHTSAQPTPAADSYAICMQRGTAECLIENNIMRDYCKVFASRACGAGSVVAYNYTDDGWDWYDTGNATTDGDYARFQECGINASHMAGPHHVLFEGNYSFNADSDYTHGNSIYITFFRNWLTGKRTSITADPEDGARCGGGAMFSYYMSYIGNVLGRSGAMSGWIYTDARMGCDGSGGSCVGSPASGWTNGTNWGVSGPNIWKVGYDPERWPCNPDTLTLSSLIRDGNYDHLTGSQKWHTTPATFSIPNSMYLSAKPTFFGANTWPWVDPSTGTTNILPAKKRYDDGTPNTVP